MQPAVPEHAPPQPVNTNPLAGATVTPTLAPETKLAKQVVPQLIPAGLLITVPPLAGVAWTVSVCGAVGEFDGVLTGVPLPELPESTRVTEPPPHPNRMLVRTRNAAQNPARRPPNWFTNSSCQAQNACRVVGPMLARR